MSTIESNPSVVEVSHQGWLPVMELATQEVFELMLGSRLVPAPPPTVDAALEVTAMVGLAGALCGVLSIRCSSRAGMAMASKMLGVEVDKALPEVWDALGEICNMVAGNFKNKIPGMGDGCMLSVPTVIMGNDYSCHSLGNAESLRVNFLFEDHLVVAVLEIHS
jgi:chemotaxis protein CheX